MKYRTEKPCAQQFGPQRYSVSLLRAIESRHRQKQPECCHTRCQLALHSATRGASFRCTLPVKILNKSLCNRHPSLRTNAQEAHSAHLPRSRTVCTPYATHTAVHDFPLLCTRPPRAHQLLRCAVPPAARLLLLLLLLHAAAAARCPAAVSPAARAAKR